MDCYDTRTGSLVPLRAMASLQLLLFFLGVVLHGRQVSPQTLIIHDAYITRIGKLLIMEKPTT